MSVYPGKTSKIYVAGHQGMVGSAIARELHRQGFQNVVGRTHKELDLRDARATAGFFDRERP
jgi:GDP-L-fucose synthase